MGFDPCNYSLKIWESIGTLIPKVGVHLGVWVIPSNLGVFIYILHTWEHDMWLPNFIFGSHLYKPLPWLQDQS
jgi:hypothetical protein